MIKHSMLSINICRVNIDFLWQMFHMCSLSLWILGLLDVELSIYLDAKLQLQLCFTLYIF